MAAREGKREDRTGQGHSHRTDTADGVGAGAAAIAELVPPRLCLPVTTALSVFC